MALSRFAPPVTDSMEQQQLLTAMPEKTKSVTAWGICVWNDWAAACAAAISETDRLIVTTPLLEMPVEDLAYWKPGRWRVASIRSKLCICLSLLYQFLALHHSIYCSIYHCTLCSALCDLILSHVTKCTGSDWLKVT